MLDTNVAFRSYNPDREMAMKVLPFITHYSDVMYTYAFRMQRVSSRFLCIFR